MKVLVSAASRHGATVEVAATIGAVLAGAGHETFVVAPDEVGSIAGYEAAVIGSGVYMGRWLEPATDLVARHKVALSAIPVWLFDSGPVGDPLKPVEESPDGTSLAALVGARGQRTFPGNVDRARLGFGERAIMAAVRASEGDFRPWNQIEGWAREIATELGAEPAIT